MLLEAWIRLLPLKGLSSKTPGQHELTDVNGRLHVARNLLGISIPVA